jgi:hypothetical protein
MKNESFIKPKIEHIELKTTYTNSTFIKCLACKELPKVQLDYLCLLIDLYNSSGFDVAKKFLDNLKETRIERDMKVKLNVKNIKNSINENSMNDKNIENGISVENIKNYQGFNLLSDNQKKQTYMLINSINLETAKRYIDHCIRFLSGLCVRCNSANIQSKSDPKDRAKDSDKMQFNFRCLDCGNFF